MRSRASMVVVMILAISIASVVTAVSSPRFIWGDDGIYISTARAIAERYQYRLSNPPAEPPQTEYPPLYPALLALVWPAGADYEQAPPALKTVNAVALALVTLLTATLVLRWGDDQSLPPLMGAALIATSPSLVSHAEQLTL